MMNNDDFERKMAFIVNQQAKFAVDLDTLSEAQKLTEQKLQEATDVVTRLAYVTNEGFKDVNAKINALVDSQIELRESQKKTDQQLDRTDRQLQRTDIQVRKLSYKVDKLSDTVDRYIRNRTNGAG
jgi:hypothetical protein